MTEIEQLRQRLSEVEAENKRLMKSADGAAYEAWQIALADQERMREALKDVVPMNWCDPMLTGPEAVLGKPYTYDGGDIERLLLAIKARLVAALSTSRQP